MDIKSITVGYQMTYNLGDYSNVRPTASFTAELKPDDDPEEVTQKLQAIARRFVEQEIDATLERQGVKPKFYSGPRYTVLEWVSTGLHVIVRDEVAGDHDRKHALPGTWRVRDAFRNDRTWSGQRAETLLDWARVLNLDLVRADHLDSLSFLSKWAELYIRERQLVCVIATNVEIPARYGRSVYELLLAVPFDLYADLRTQPGFDYKTEAPIASMADVLAWFDGNHPRHQAALPYFSSLADIVLYTAEQIIELDKQFGVRPTPKLEPDQRGEPDGDPFDDSDDDDDEDDNE